MDWLNIDDETWKYVLADMKSMSGDHAVGEPNWNFSSEEQPDQSFVTGEQESHQGNYLSILSEYATMFTVEEALDHEVLKAAQPLNENSCSTGLSLCDLHLHVQQLELE